MKRHCWEVLQFSKLPEIITTCAELSKSPRQMFPETRTYRVALGSGSSEDITALIEGLQAKNPKHDIGQWLVSSMCIVRETYTQLPLNAKGETFAGAFCVTQGPVIDFVWPTGEWRQIMNEGVPTHPMEADEAARGVHGRQSARGRIPVPLRRGKQG